MKKLTLGVVGAILAVATVGLTSFGGWAVVSVAKVPDAWVVGRPLQLSWDVRQHGVDKLFDLTPTIEARSGSKVIQGMTWAFNENGGRGYRGRIVFPSAGEWQVTIRSGFGRSRAVLLPMGVVDSLRAIQGTVADHLASIGVSPATPAEHGRRVFAGVGCVTCHVHRDVAIEGELRDFGPDLSDRRFAADYLAKFLANPAIKPASPDGKRMPNLDLKDKDITALVAFINAERRVTSR